MTWEPSEQEKEDLRVRPMKDLLGVCPHLSNCRELETVSCAPCSRTLREQLAVVDDILSEIISERPPK